LWPKTIREEEKQFGVNFDKVLVCDRATDGRMDGLDFHLTLITCSNETKQNKTKLKPKPKAMPNKNEAIRTKTETELN